MVSWFSYGERFRFAVLRFVLEVLTRLGLRLPPAPSVVPSTPWYLVSFFQLPSYISVLPASTLLCVRVPLFQGIGGRGANVFVGTGID